MPDDESHTPAGPNEPYQTEAVTGRHGLRHDPPLEQTMMPDCESLSSARVRLILRRIGSGFY
ncbi:MAG: hypothetical protein ABI613_03025, partial [Gemmatimonadota bacterium]